MDNISVNGVTYWLPADEDDVIALVNEAYANKEIICLRGSAHSFPMINTLEKGSRGGRPYKYVMLSYLMRVNLLPDDMVFVQAGCHLGPDPWDPSGLSTPENSLLVQLDAAGLAIPDLGGITHQTVGGFLSTASSGGSTQFSFDDSLMSIDFICCGPNGAEKVTYTRPSPDNPDDEFYGAGVATLGLFGIIVSATFKCVPKFYIAGQEATTTVADCEVDLFDQGQPGKLSMEQFLRATQYTRLMWWPQANVTKMVVWKAWQTDEQGAAAQAAAGYAKIGDKPPYKPLKPYEEVPAVPLLGPNLAALGADILFTAIGTWPTWLETILGKDTAMYESVKKTLDTYFYPDLLPLLLGFFVSPDKPDVGPQLFSDTWYNGLPMDNQMSDKLMPVWFTELWIPIEKSKEAMNDLLNFYNKGPENTGAFSCEIYAAKKSAFWLNPAYMTDVIRIDVFWFGNNSGNPADFYQKFWDLLAKYQFRPHWGKYIPDKINSVGSPGEDLMAGPVYLKDRYPKWEQWHALRAKMDPHQVFLNDYWRAKLGITTTAG